MGIANNKIAMCNQSLSLIGAKQINSFEDTSEEARQAALMYDETLDWCLSANEWQFASYIVIPAIVNEEISTVYPYVYRLPSDYLRLISLNPQEEIVPFDPYVMPWKVEENDEDEEEQEKEELQVRYRVPRRHTLTIPLYQISDKNIETFIKDPLLKYVRRIEDPSSLPAYFREYFVYYLAYKLGERIRGNSNKNQEMLELAEFRKSSAIELERKQTGPQYLDIRNKLSDIIGGR